MFPWLTLLVMIRICSARKWKYSDALCLYYLYIVSYIYHKTVLFPHSLIFIINKQWTEPFYYLTSAAQWHDTEKEEKEEVGDIRYFLTLWCFCWSTLMAINPLQDPLHWERRRSPEISVAAHHTTHHTVTREVENKEGQDIIDLLLDRIFSCQRQEELWKLLLFTMEFH